MFLKEVVGRVKRKAFGERLRMARNRDALYKELSFIGKHCHFGDTETLKKGRRASNMVTSRYYLLLFWKHTTSFHLARLSIYLLIDGLADL